MMILGKLGETLVMMLHFLALPVLYLISQSRGNDVLMQTHVPSLTTHPQNCLCLGAYHPHRPTIAHSVLVGGFPVGLAILGWDDAASL